jgi:LPXTG-motif cell wall-anchored protein
VTATLVALALPATAMATPCGDKVLADWFDNGRIDRLYDLHCYEDAIDAIPNDLRDYANAEEIISRALQAAVGGKLDPGGPDPSPEGDGGGTGTGGPDDPANPDGSVASPDVDTTGLSSVPIPLIILGLMSLALLAAGGFGYLRRRHAGEDGEGPDDLVI